MNTNDLTVGMSVENIVSLMNENGFEFGLKNYFDIKSKNYYELFFASNKKHLIIQCNILNEKLEQAFCAGRLEDDPRKNREIRKFPKVFIMYSEKSKKFMCSASSNFFEFIKYLEETNKTIPFENSINPYLPLNYLEEKLLLLDKENLKKNDLLYLKFASANENMKKVCGCDEKDDRVKLINEMIKLANEREKAATY